MKFAIAVVMTMTIGFAQSPPTDDARNRAARLFNEGRYVEAKALVQAHLNENQSSAPWWIMAAEVHLELEDYESACHHFRRAHELDSTLDPMMVRYGLALVRVGRTREASVWLKPYLESKDRDRRSTALYFLALAMLAEDQPSKARLHLQEALMLTPNHARLHIRVAQLDFVDGRFDEAVTHADLALQLKPLSVAAAHTRSLALSRLKRTDDARRAVAKHRALLDINDKISSLVSSLATTTEPAVACVSIAELARSGGDRELSLVWANRALVRDPTSTAARKLVGELRAESRPTTRESP